MAEENGDPDAAESDGRDATDKRCDHCGATIETSDWYPVTNERDGDGSVRLYEFCGTDCQAAWRDERGD